MSYFISKDDLDKAIDAVFTAIAKMFTDKDKEINRKLKELNEKFNFKEVKALKEGDIITK